MKWVERLLQYPALPQSGTRKAEADAGICAIAVPAQVRKGISRKEKLLPGLSNLLPLERATPGVGRWGPKR